MNKIYKTVWSKARGMYIVVSELATGHAKSPSARKRTAAVLAAFLLLSSGEGVATAEGLTADQQAVYDAVLAALKREQTIELGYGSKAVVNEATAVGYGNQANGEKSSAVGYGNQANRDRSSAVGFGNIAGGSYSNAVGNSNIVTAEGKKASAVGYWNYINNYGAVALGSQNNKMFKNPYEMGDTIARTGALSVAVGIGNLAAGDNSVVFGRSGYALGDRSVALGSALAEGSESVSIGAYTSVGNESGDSQVHGNDYQRGIAIGSHARTAHSDSVALGSFARVAKDAGVRGYDARTQAVITDADLPQVAAGNVTATQIAEYRAKLATAEQEFTEARDLAEARILAYQTEQPGVTKEELPFLRQAAAEKEAAWHAARKQLAAAVGAWESTMGAVAIGNEEYGISRQLTGVAAGSEDTDAVNVAQLKALATQVNEKGSMNSWKLKAGAGATEDIGDGETVAFDVAVADKGLTVARDGKTIKYGIDASKLDLSNNTAITSLTTKVDGNTTNITDLTNKLAAGFRVQGGSGTAATVNLNGTTAPLVKFEASDAAGSKGLTVTNNGTTITYGIDRAKLKETLGLGDTVGTMSGWKLKAKGDTAAETIADEDEVVFDVAVADKGLTVARDGKTIKYGIDASKLDLSGNTAITNIANTINNGGTPITHISAKFSVSGAANANRKTVTLTKDAVPNIQFLGEANTIDVEVGGTDAAPSISIGLAQEVKNKLDALSTSTDRSVQYDLQADGATVDKTKITLAGGAEGTTITNVKDGALSEDSKDAVNGSQLNATNERVTKVEGDVSTIKTQINNLEAQANANKVTVEGDDVTGVQVDSTTAADGTKYTVKLKDTIQVGGADGVVIKGKDKVIRGLSNTTLDTGYGAGDRAGQAATEGQLKAAVESVASSAATIVKEGANITVAKTDGKNEYTVALNKDLTEIDSISVGADAEGKGAVVINKDGIQAGGKKITGVADGELSEDSKDAVNGSQLFATNERVAQNTTNITQLGDQIINMGHELNGVRQESREGLAMGAALAALKPLQYDPYDRNQIMAGVGHYKGESAVALGISHFANERTMWHAGVALGAKSETMLNAGVTWRFGGDDERSKLPERYQDGPISSVYVLQDEVAALQEQNAKLISDNQRAQERVEAIDAENKEIRAQNEQILAELAALRQAMQG